MAGVVVRAGFDHQDAIVRKSVKPPYPWLVTPARNTKNLQDREKKPDMQILAEIKTFCKLCRSAKPVMLESKRILKQQGQLRPANSREKNTQVAPEAREGKPRAKTGRNTQTNSSSDHQGDKPVNNLTRPNGAYFK
jgi:hypothetical protein